MLQCDREGKVNQCSIFDCKIVGFISTALVLVKVYFSLSLDALHIASILLVVSQTT